MFATLRQCLGLLTPQERWQWLGLVPLTLVVSGMEIVSAAMVFALLKVLGDPSQIVRLPIPQTISESFVALDSQRLVLLCTALVAGFYLLRNVVLAVGAYVRSKIVSHSTATLAERLLKGYLRVPYAFHLQRNSAHLTYNLTGAAETVFGTVMTAAVAVVSEILIGLGIVLVLMTATPLMTLLAGAILGGLLAMLLALTRRALHRWGTRTQALQKAILQCLQQTFGSLKDVKVLGREGYVLREFASQYRALQRLQYRRVTLDEVPRLLVETAFVSGLLVVVTLMTLQGQAGADLLPLLGLYAYAGFRIIPAANRILWRLNEIRYGASAVQQLYHDYMLLGGHVLARYDTATNAPLPFTDCLSMEGVTYTYPGANRPALQDVHVTIRHGESIGLVGATGAGKSTLVDTLIGLLQPDSGRVTVDGTDVQTRLRGWQRQIGYVPQAIFLADDSLRRNIALGVPEAEIDDCRVQAAVCMAQLAAFVATLPAGLDTCVGERGIRLSGGERQRVGMARALYHKPEVLVFDEATSALDQGTEGEVMQAIAALHGKTTLLIIAHRLSTVRHCDRLIFLRNGRVSGCGTFATLMTQNPDFRTLTTLTTLDGTVPQG